MPTTYNGVGTHYYGKKNLQKRTDVCRGCGQRSVLSSYDTRLWFVVLFIPVIPLKKKRITDDCSACRRHYAADQEKWEMARQLGVSGAMDKFRSEPTAESALELHGCLLGFHMRDDAKKFRDEAVTQFPDNIMLWEGLGSHLDEVGSYEEATPYYEKAHELRPENPLARVALSRRRMAEGKLDEARKLLDFLEQPGAGQTQNLAILETLAQCYQKAKRHTETLELCRFLISELPEVGKVHNFRKFVATSERAAGQSESLLPERSFSVGSFFNKHGSYPAWQRYSVAGGAIALLVLGGLAIHNEYRRTHRTLQVVNGLGNAVQVAVGDNEPVEVLDQLALTVPEGKHHVKVTGAVAEEFDIDLNSSYFQRWTRSPEWIVSPGGAAVVGHLTAYYTEKGNRPPDIKFHIGERFLSFPHIDYSFDEELPKEVKLSKSKGTEVRTQLVLLDILNSNPAQVFHVVIDGKSMLDMPPKVKPPVGSPERALAFDYAESHLKQNRENESLLDNYIDAAFLTPDAARAEKFLEASLLDQPISVIWNRALHRLKNTPESEAALLARYDEAIKNDPKSAALKYLRGRISPDKATSNRYFTEAIELDPKFGWAWYALLVDVADTGDWAKAKELAKHVREATPQHEQWQKLLHLTRLANGEAAQLATEYKTLLDKQDEQTNLFQLLPHFADASAVQGKVAEAKREIDKQLNPLIAGNEIPLPLRVFLRVLNMTLGEVGNPDDLKPFRADAGARGQHDHELALAGRPAEIAETPNSPDIKNPDTALQISIAFALAGDAAKANEWRIDACRLLEQLSTEGKKFAAYLKGDSPPTLAQLDEQFYPGSKPMYLIVLSQHFPQQKKEYLAYAEKLNISRVPPYLLVKKAIDTAK